jgi:hypothetical protein
MQVRSNSESRDLVDLVESHRSLIFPLPASWFSPHDTTPLKSLQDDLHTWCMCQFTLPLTSSVCTDMQQVHQTTMH